MSNAPEVNEEMVWDGVARGFKTQDFEFVSMALTGRAYCNTGAEFKQLDLNAEVKALLRIDDPERKRTNSRFMFILVPKHAASRQEFDMWYAMMTKVAMDFANKNLLVEPTALSGSRRFLRGICANAEQQEPSQDSVLLLQNTGSFQHV